MSTQTTTQTQPTDLTLNADQAREIVEAIYEFHPVAMKAWMDALNPLQRLWIGEEYATGLETGDWEPFAAVLSEQEQSLTLRLSHDELDAEGTLHFWRTATGTIQGEFQITACRPNDSAAEDEAVTMNNRAHDYADAAIHTLSLCGEVHPAISRHAQSMMG